MYQGGEGGRKKRGKGGGERAGKEGGLMRQSDCITGSPDTSLNTVSGCVCESFSRCFMAKTITIL